jgi:integrase
VSIDDWPDADRAAWQHAIRPEEFLGDPGALASLPRPVLVQHAAAFGRWLAFVISTGATVPPESGRAVLDRPRLQAFNDYLRSWLAPYTVRNYLKDLLAVCRAMDPEAVFADLAALVGHARRSGYPTGSKRLRMKPSDQLLDFGFKLMAKAEQRLHLLGSAGRFGDGLIIALLASRPIRRANLASIEIDRHLTREGDLYWLSFPAAEMKNHRSLTFPLPAILSPPLDRYIGFHRPRLLAQSGRWARDVGQALWVSQDGSPLTGNRIYARILKRTEEYFGKGINLHLFRDAAATSIALEDPRHVGIIMSILGHSSHQTAERFYNQAGNVEAARSLQRVFRELRDKEARP